MTKSELWNVYVKSNPSFEGQNNIIISPKGLKKLFDQTWEMAQERPIKSSSSMENIFADIFGKR